MVILKEPECAVRDLSEIDVQLVFSDGVHLHVIPRIYAINSFALIDELADDCNDPYGRLDIFCFFRIPIHGFGKAEFYAVEMPETAAAAQFRSDVPAIFVFELNKVGDLWKLRIELYERTVPLAQIVPSRSAQ